LLSISHHRWYVARTFIGLVGTDITEEQAKRILAEIVATDFPFAKRFAQVCSCITTNREALHPKLRDLS